MNALPWIMNHFCLSTCPPLRKVYTLFLVLGRGTTLLFRFALSSKARKEAFIRKTIDYSILLIKEQQL